MPKTTHLVWLATTLPQKSAKRRFKMRANHFDRTLTRLFQALVIGLILALGIASISCSSEKSAEAEESHEEEGFSKSSKKKSKAYDEDEDQSEESEEAEGPPDKAASHKSDGAGKNSHAASGHSSPKPPMSPEQALARLKEGNENFIKGMVSFEHLAEAHRAALVGGQRPFAMVLSCADSRVPPEQVFAQGLGDIFTVRVAGNIAEPATIASLEYAAAHLGTPLLVIMGHTECGAVKAAMAGASDTPNITQLVKAIQPAVAKHSKSDDTTAAVQANVSHTHEELLRQSKLLSDLVDKKRLKVVEAVYDLKTGRVKFESGK
jgi:carbonic anhydrase